MNWAELSDRELVEECLRSMGTEAWREFLRRFQPLIARVVSRTLRSWTRPAASLVDDLVQSSLQKIFDNDLRAMRNFRWQHENSFRGFLKVVASNVTLDHIRKNRWTHQEQDLEEVGPEALKTETFTKSVETEALVHKLTSCLQKLLSGEADFNRDLAMFLLYYRYGLTAKQISGLYSLTVKAVENTLLRLIRIAKARCI